MKSNLQILKDMQDKIMYFEPEEFNHVLSLLKLHAYEPSAAAERISEYLSEMLPVQVSKEFIFDLL